MCTILSVTTYVLAYYSSKKILSLFLGRFFPECTCLRLNLNTYISKYFTRSNQMVVLSKTAHQVKWYHHKADFLYNILSTNNPILYMHACMQMMMTMTIMWWRFSNATNADVMTMREKRYLLLGKLSALLSCWLLI